MNWLLAVTAILVRLFNPDGSYQEYQCVPTPTTVTVTVTTTSLQATTTTTLPVATKSLLTAGYLGLLDPATVPVWPKKLAFMVGNGTAQGPLIASARQLAISSGNPSARFIFYFSLTDMDSQGGGFDPGFYNQFITTHPEWILHDASGNKVSTLNGPNRVFATDIGNLAYIDAWAAYAQTKGLTPYPWDGLMIDNVIRGLAGWPEWSARPINPRKGGVYALADYRFDMIGALNRLQTRLPGKLLIGNASGCWHGSFGHAANGTEDTFADPLVRTMVTALAGVELEDAVFNYNGAPQAETDALDQLKYADYLTQLGKVFIAKGPTDSTRQETLAAFVLLTQRGASAVAEMNSVADYKTAILDRQLGPPSAPFECIDSAGTVTTVGCVGLGKTYRRRFAGHTVAWNPTGVSRTVPLGQSTPCGTVVPLPPKTGKMC